MSLHRLSHVIMGVPDVAATTSYYTDFGLQPSGSSMLATRDGGNQLGIVGASSRRLVELGVAADEPDDLARIAASLQRLGHSASLEDDALLTAEPV